jgi:hypothetical protein
MMDLSHCGEWLTEKKKRDCSNHVFWEATSGLEPLVQLLQSRALPLGDVAAYYSGRGAGDGDRTRDFLLGKEMLYH